MASKSVSVSGPVDIESTAKQPVIATEDLSSQRLYHGTRVDLKPGDLIAPSREPLRVAGEVTDWQGHSPEALKAMKDHIERLRQLGVEAVDD